jgi:hypothetical protein
MRPNRPHIPSFITSSKSQKTKQIRGANRLAFPEPPYLQISQTNPQIQVSVPASPNPRFRPSPSLFRFGEPLSTATSQNPQEEKTPQSHFLHIIQKLPNIWRLRQQHTQITITNRNFVSQIPDKIPRKNNQIQNSRKSGAG